MLCPLFRAKASWGQASLESTDSDTWIEMKAEFDFRKPVVPALVAWVWRVSRRSIRGFTAVKRCSTVMWNWHILPTRYLYLPIVFFPIASKSSTSTILQSWFQSRNHSTEVPQGWVHTVDFSRHAKGLFSFEESTFKSLIPGWIFKVLES